MLAQISLIGAGLAVACPPPAGWLGDQGGVVDRGERDAVLVDALPTVGQARDLADWVAAHDMNLTAVYITHGHGDHWFGLSVILDRFPTARAFALPSVIEQMRQGSAPEILAMWNRLFPGQIPDPLVLAEPLPDGGIVLEGHQRI